MRTADWFAQIKFYTFDILIQKDSIITTEPNDKSIPSLSLDDTISTIFSIPTPSDDITRIFIKSRHYNIVSTGCKIQLKYIKLNEFSLMPTIMMQQLMDFGIIAVRFYKDRVQYLLDIQKFLAKWNDKK